MHNYIDLALLPLVCVSPITMRYNIEYSFKPITILQEKNINFVIFIHCSQYFISISTSIYKDLIGTGATHSVQLCFTRFQAGSLELNIYNWCAVSFASYVVPATCNNNNAHFTHRHTQAHKDIECNLTSTIIAFRCTFDH